MSQTFADMGGVELAFDHGVAEDETRPDVAVTIRALRRAIGRTADDTDAAVMAELFTQLVRERQYTEGHHPVRVEVTEEERNRLHLAHLVAADNIPEDDVAETFIQNKKKLP